MLHHNPNKSSMLNLNMPPKKDIGKALATSYGLTVQPKSWVLPNRVKFGPWIDNTFRYKKKAYTKCTECEEGEACPVKFAVQSTSLFPHQEFIKDYMQFASPYRGLLVYHGLGSGKSCSSIAAAEILLNSMDVCVMLPASLRDNYINEVKKCGCDFFKPNQHWQFTKGTGSPESRTLLKVSSEVIKKNGGLWIPTQDKEPNYKGLSETQRVQIQTQIHDMIEQRFTFINYNGLQRKTIENMIVDGKNPFDNKAIIVDEIHNLVSRIVNGRQIGGAVYKLLMTATNCKLILLSGTPIINYPFEIAYILNLITGPIKYYELKANKNSEFNRDTIEECLVENAFVDDFSIDISGRRITVNLLPLGFHVVDRKNSKVARYPGAVKSHEDIMDTVISGLKKVKHDMNKKFSSKETTLFPEKREDFDMLFVNEEQGTTRNQRLFMKRALGTVSYYNSFSPELFPSWRIHDVPAPMNSLQFTQYEKSRADERKKESGVSKFKKNNSDGLFGNSGQVYRFFSRAVCNFVFPAHIKRPFPSKLSDMKKEIDDEDDVIEALGKDQGEDDAVDKKSKKVEEYQRQLEQCLQDLYKEKDNFLSKENLAKYSPKFAKVIENLDKVKGNTLVYSQFRKVEGLGVLGLALQANGWAEFKIKKEGNGKWKVNMTEEELKRPCYAAFTGNNEESRIILKIFNNETDGVPTTIQGVIARRNNLRGDIIKTLMITQSGAEGLSLKNTRQVHILEPYWNHIRLDQVIGRAVRTCSHVALEPEERNVEVFVYYSTFTKEQKDAPAFFTLRTLDKSMTSDEYLYGIAKKKKAITDGLLDMLKKASIDCVLNGKHHGIKCFAFPVNMDSNLITRQPNINMEEHNVSFAKGVEEKEWKGQLLRTKKGNFVIKEGTNDVYDYDAYMNSGKVTKVGTITKEGTSRIIKFVD